MALSLAIIILLGLLSDSFLRRMNLPGLLGMLAVGIVLGPYALNMLHPTLLEVSKDFRIIALIVILLRAGLKIKKDTLNRVGGTALRMSVLPSTLEGLAITVAAHFIFSMSYVQAVILGFIVAAVSPAVVVPSMINLIDRKLGTNKGIPTMILASSSLDNAFVIVVFSAVLGMYPESAGAVYAKLIEIPVSIILGTLVGAILGLLIYKFFAHFKPRHTKKTLILIGIAILLTWAEESIRQYVAFSGLLGVMTIGFILLEKSEDTAHAISEKLSKIWVLAEIMLFVLVGAQVNIQVALDAGLKGVGVIAIGLIARSLGTLIATTGSGLSQKERLFCTIAYLPKATVQAAIGAIPLAVGVPGGEIMLAVAVMSIIITAPIGAIGINMSAERLLKKED